MSLTYKKADPLVHGAVKKLTCITEADKQSHKSNNNDILPSSRLPLLRAGGALRAQSHRLADGVG